MPTKSSMLITKYEYNIDKLYMYICCPQGSKVSKQSETAKRFCYSEPSRSDQTIEIV